MLAVAACSREVAHNPLPVAAYEKTSLQEIFPDRFWGDELPPNFEKELRKAAPRLRQRFDIAKEENPGEPAAYRLLAISGGGANGAFAAGVLAGWTESGSRVGFDVVTGVSTGAIIAPFAFLGPDYDDTIVEIYESGAREKVFEFALVGGLLLGSAATDTTPLKREIERYITLDLIEAIADEHDKGKYLYIITTHFDANRPVVWDIGSIAARRDEEAVRLVRQVILASTAIPALFPPVPFEFELNGERFTELHVDGGLSNNLFAYPAQIQVNVLNDMLELPFQREVYLLINANEQFRYDPAPTGVVSITRRAISALLQNQLNADVDRIFRVSRRDDVAFNYVAIPESFDDDGATEFDPEYMQSLVDLGQEIGRTGNFWKDRPYSAAPDE